MATVPTVISIEEYLSASYHPDADYVNGEIEEGRLGEYEHARLQFILPASSYSTKKSGMCAA